MQHDQLSDRRAFQKSHASDDPDHRAEAAGDVSWTFVDEIIVDELDGFFTHRFNSHNFQALIYWSFFQ